jgi:hypothetical protein
MDEARRFLRYVTPGLTFAVQALLLFFIANQTWTIKQLHDLSEKSGVGSGITLFLASGGFGYLFSVIHHWLHWFLPFTCLSAIDHTQAVQQLLEETPARQETRWLRRNEW